MLSLLLQASLVAPHENQRRDEDEQTQCDRNQSDRSCQPMHNIAEEVASQPVDCDPGDSPERVEEQKGSPRHAVSSGQERGPGTQDGDKATKEDYFAAVLAEEILSQFHFALIETDVAAIAAQQTIATFAPNPVAEIIAQNCATGSSRDHQCDREAVGRSSIDSRDEEHGLARKGYAHALDGHKEQHRPVAVGCQKMRQLGCGKMEHVNCAFFTSPPTYKRYLLF